MSGISKKLMSAFSGVAGPVEAQAVDFDGTNDYLSRSYTDGSFGSGSKTVTFSCYFYWSGTESETIFSFPTFSVTLNASGNLFSFSGFSNSYATLLGYQTNSGIAKDTWNHALFSFDLSNAANRHVYINDTPVAGTFTSYVNTPIGFDVSGPATISQTTAGPAFKGRLSNVFLDYTYRDLSVEANRRLFITDEGTPASGQASLSPILYLPMDDPADVGRNDGTGGDFTLNGVVAQSGRGPNQYNAAASEFNSSDFMRSTSTFSAISTKTITFSIIAKRSSTTNFYVLGIDNNSDLYGYINWYNGLILFKNSSASNIFVIGGLSGKFAPAVKDRFIQLDVSFDLSDTQKRHVIIDGEDVTSSVSFSTYANDSVYISNAFFVNGYFTAGNAGTDGEVSRIYFDDSYIDLSASNPFYDTETDKPKFLGEFGELPTGSAPLIYLPLRADDAGNNKGTGGDFTVNSGPYVGARGPSEYWGEAAEFNGTSQYLNKATQLTGLTDSKVFTVAVGVKIDVFAGKSHSIITKDSTTSSSYGRFRLFISSGTLRFLIRDASDTIIVNLGIGTVSTEGNWVSLLFTFDSANQSNCLVYADGVSKSITFNTFTTDYLIPFLSALPHTKIGANQGSDVTSDYLDGRIGFLWFNTEYIDFSQEANRLKFFDAFGYPVDLGEDGSLPTGNVPLIYMNEGFRLGTNLGSGGNFTPVNAPTDGGYVKG